MQQVSRPLPNQPPSSQSPWTSQNLQMWLLPRGHLTTSILHTCNGRQGLTKWITSSSPRQGNCELILLCVDPIGGLRERPRLVSTNNIAPNRLSELFAAIGLCLEVHYLPCLPLHVCSIGVVQRACGRNLRLGTPSLHFLTASPRLHMLHPCIGLARTNTLYRCQVGLGKS